MRMALPCSNAGRGPREACALSCMASLRSECRKGAVSSMPSTSRSSGRRSALAAVASGPTVFGFGGFVLAISALQQGRDLFREQVEGRLGGRLRGADGLLQVRRAGLEA